MKLVLILVSLSYAVASPALQLAGRIIGGEDIPIEKVPHQISLQNAGEHICGGSIIASNYVVTAGHCTYWTTAEVLSVRAGSSIRGSGGQVVNVKKIHNHPKFKFNVVPYYDIALIELDEDLVFGDTVAAIPLPSANQSWPVGSEVLVTGWGVTNPKESTPATYLQGVTVELIDQETCNQEYGGIVTSQMLCAGVEEGGKDACSFDSGGPLQIDGVLVGIVSWGNGCAKRDYPGVYANVAGLLDFIQDVIGQ